MALDSTATRHAFTTLIRDARGRVLRGERQPFHYRRLPDTRVHRARDGDTLLTLAALHYRGMSQRPAQLWWVIADFQPEPISDPTVDLEPGRLLHIPSPTVVQTQILGGLREDAAPIG